MELEEAGRSSGSPPPPGRSDAQSGYIQILANGGISPWPHLKGTIRGVESGKLKFAFFQGGNEKFQEGVSGCGCFLNSGEMLHQVINLR